MNESVDEKAGEPFVDLEYEKVLEIEVHLHEQREQDECGNRRQNRRKSLTKEPHTPDPNKQKAHKEENIINLLRWHEGEPEYD